MRDLSLTGRWQEWHRAYFVRGRRTSGWHSAKLSLLIGQQELGPDMGRIDVGSVFTGAESRRAWNNDDVCWAEE